jgi:hypothetical protein
MSKSTIKKIVMIAAGVSVFTAGTMVGLPTANAALSSCPRGYACGWADDWYNGEVLSFSDSRSNFNNMNNRISSIYNNGNYQYVRWYVDVNFVGFNLGQPMGSQIAGLQPWGFNNSFSSGRFTSP